MTRVVRRLRDALRKLIRPDLEKVKEDVRKLGTTLVPAGIVAMILPEDKVDTEFGLIMLVLGILFWFFGIQKKKVEAKED